MSTAVPLPLGSSLGKSFEYGLDINLGTYASPTWQPVRRMSGFAPTFPKTTTDVASYDDLGAPNEDVTGRGFTAAFNVQVNRLVSSGMYLPEIEALIAAGRTKGDAAVLDIRFYHKPEVGTPNPDDAGRAFVTVELSRNNTGNSETEILGVTLTGKGEYSPIANPFAGWTALAPVITDVDPDSAAAGELMTITGTSLLGATAVKFGTTNAEFEVFNGSTIVAVMPTGTAGPVNLTVVTPVGTSAAVSVTRL